MRSAKEKLEDNGIDEGVEIIDDEAFGESLIGITTGNSTRAVYSYEKMVEEYAAFHGVSIDDAADHINYNIIRGLDYMGGEAPIVIDILNL